MVRSFKPNKKEKSKICNKNEFTFEELILSINTSGGDSCITFQSVCCCKNDNYKNGNVADAWKCLTDKYTPNIVPIKELELKSEFQCSRLWDAAQDPNV